MVGFKMAEMWPELVEGMVVTCSVMAFTEEVSTKGLEKIGFKSWKDYLIPDSVNGVKVLLQIGSYHLPTMPNWVYKHFLEVMFDHRKEKEELLEALLVSGQEFVVPQYTQRVHLLWGENDNIFDMEVADALKMQLGEKTTLSWIEKAGHLVNLERPCVYNSRLNKILASFFEEGKD